MSDWQNKLKKHPVHTELRTLMQVVRKQRKFNDAETDAVLNRLMKILIEATKILTAAEDTFLSSAALDSVLGNINAIRGNFNTLESNRANPETFPPLLDEINAHIGTMLLYPWTSSINQDTCN